jgi:hypothetical protein
MPAVAPALRHRQQQAAPMGGKAAKSNRKEKRLKNAHFAHFFRKKFAGMKKKP